MKNHVLILSKTFPKWHPRAGEPTGFKERIANAIYHMRHPKVFEPGEPNNGNEKYHTIRGNYERWKKIIDEVRSGEAELSVREWSGIPYRSHQLEIQRFTNRDYISVQKLDLKLASFSPFYIEVDRIDEERRTDTVHVGLLANNDGLSLTDWQFWFEKSDLSQPFAIIQFTSFRY